MENSLKNKPELSQKEWFNDWFDTPFYHILYKNRDFGEAQLFIDNLADFLQFQAHHKILDLACGRGRHAIYLNQKGLNVVGIDLSTTNIAYARQFENERLRFFVHDMREVFEECCFDFIVNLFTSFGYFETDEEDLKVIQAATYNLKSGGRFLIDFLNPDKIIHQIRPHEVKLINDIEFHIQKSYQNGFIFKEIDFEYEGKEYHYQERVKSIDLAKFQSYFEQTQLNIIHIFGNYQLDKFQPNESDRMIFVLEKR